MQSSMTLTMLKALALLLTFLSLVLASPLVDTALGVYNVGGMAFKGTVHGIAFESSGTVEEMYAELSKLYPEIVANVSTVTYPVTRELETRDLSGYLCTPISSQPWQPADEGRIQQGIEYLNNFAGVCGTGPGPGPANCVRVSCSYDSGIYLCNDSPYTLTLACGAVANYARDLCDWCATHPPNSFWQVGGQIFDEGGWNVVVRKDSC